MSADPTQVLAFETDCHIFDGCGFPAPGLHSFLFKPLVGHGGNGTSWYFDKTMLLAVLGSIIIVAFFWAAFRKPKLVPGKLQMVAEAGYDFVRRGIVYETLGKREGEKYVPLVVSLFFFVWMMNLWSIIPLAQFPVTAIISYPIGLALIVYVLWVSLTFKRHGFIGAIKNFGGYDKSLGPVLPLAMGIEALLEPAGPALHARGATVREHVRGPHADPAVHDRQLVPAERHRYRLRGGVVRDGPRDDRLRTLHPGVAGVRVRPADVHLHPGCPRGGPR